MARTWTTQWDMESTIRSPRSALRSLTRGSAFGAVATLTTSAAAASGARNIESPPDARILNRVREERHSQMHLASTGVANIRRLWCPGNIPRAERSFGGRRSMARGRNVAAAGGVNQRFAQSAGRLAAAHGVGG